MVTTTEGLTNLHELQAEKFTGQVHGDLSRHGKHLGSRLRLKSVHRDFPRRGDPWLNNAHTIVPGGPRRRDVIRLELVADGRGSQVYVADRVLARRNGQALAE